MHSLLSLSFAALVGQCCAQLSLATTPKLNLTALGADKGESTIECWQLDAPFTTSAGAGTAGALALNMGDLSNATYTILPSRFDGGFHQAPALQYVSTTCFTLQNMLVGLMDTAC
jgi:hypothetical protein